MCYVKSIIVTICTQNFFFNFIYFFHVPFRKRSVRSCTMRLNRTRIIIFDCFRIFSSGIEGNPTVFYRLMPGSTAQTNKFHTFYLQQRPDNGFTWADIKVNHPLDYETIKEYNLTIRVEVMLKKKTENERITNNRREKDAAAVCMTILVIFHFRSM